MTDHQPMPVAGYTAQPQSNVDLANEGKELEERYLRWLDKLAAHSDTDKRCVALGVIKMEPMAIRFRSKREDFATTEDQRIACELSAHIVMQMRDIAANTFAMMEHIGKQLEDKLGIEHTPGVDFDPELDH